MISTSPSLSEAQRAELDSLHFESDPELKAFGLFSLAGRLERAERLDAALSLYGEVLALPSQSDLARKARERMAALSGGGGFGSRAERCFSSFFRDAADPRMVLPMIGASAIFPMAQAFAFSRLSAAYGRKFFSAAIGFGVEVPVFVALSRGVGEIMNSQAPSNELGQEILAAGLSLGLLKIAGGGAQGLLSKFGPRPFATLSLAAREGSLLGGLMLAHRLEETLHWRPETDGMGLLFGASTSLLGLKIGARWSRALLGTGFGDWQWRMRMATGDIPRPSAGWGPASVAPTAPSPGRGSVGPSVESPPTPQAMWMSGGGGDGFARFTPEDARIAERFRSSPDKLRQFLDRNPEDWSIERRAKWVSRYDLTGGLSWLRELASRPERSHERHSAQLAIVAMAKDRELFRPLLVDLIRQEIAMKKRDIPTALAPLLPIYHLMGFIFPTEGTPLTRAIRLLADWRVQEIAPELREIWRLENRLGTGGYSGEGIEAVRALYLFGDKEAVSILRKLVGSRKSAVAFEASALLAKGGDPTGLQSLRKIAAASPDRGDQAAASCILLDIVLSELRAAEAEIGQTSVGGSMALGRLLRWLESKEMKNIEEVTSKLWHYLPRDPSASIALLLEASAGPGALEKRYPVEDPRTRLLGLSTGAVSARLLWSLGEADAIRSYLRYLKEFDDRIGFDRVMRRSRAMREEVQELGNWKKYSTERPGRILELLHSIETRLRDETWPPLVLLKPNSGG